MNPLTEFITDEQYDKLKLIDVISFTGERNYSLRKKYKRLKKKMKSIPAIKKLQKENLYLTFDTVRKICQCKKYREYL